MSFSRSFAAAALALLPCLSGCAEMETADETADVPLVGLTGGSSGGTNGASDLEFWLLAPQILAATNVPLVSPGTMDVNPAIVAGLLADPAGERMLDYMVQCAVGTREPTNIVYRGLKEFHGKGHLSTTASWLSGPLSAQGTNDLFACMLIHLNPLDLHVDILLSGLDIVDDGEDHSDFTVPEAVWIARKVGSQMHYTVWPTEPFTTLCAADPMDALINRVCGHDPEACGVQKGADFAQDCIWQSSSGGYLCNGRRAILTTLKEPDVYDLHPMCDPLN